MNTQINLVSYLGYLLVHIKLLYHILHDLPFICFCFFPINNSNFTPVRGVRLRLINLFLLQFYDTPNSYGASQNKPGEYHDEAVNR